MERSDIKKYSRRFSLLSWLEPPSLSRSGVTFDLQNSGELVKKPSKGPV
jgi:hypothetical protein